MIVQTLRDLLAVLPDATTTVDGAARRRRLRRIVTDSRSLTTGEGFLALRGDRFDGHDFVRQAIEAGAPVAIVDRRWFVEAGEPAELPLVVVDDTLRAYGEIAHQHRMSFDIPIVAVAGSNGKTTTKELIADLLATRHTILRTEGNLNNLIGVPAMLLRLRPEQTAAVIEIGTNTPGEIARLCEILAPTHGVITSIGREHLELLGSLEGVAREEGALFEYLEAHRGTAVVSLDDPHIAAMGKKLPGAVTYGTKGNAMIHGRVGRVDAVGAPSLTITDRRRAKETSVSVQLQTPGRHTAANALAAAAVARTLGIPLRDIRRVLESFVPTVSKGGYARLAPMTSRYGTVILNDTYNANPDSTVVALQTLASIRPPKGGIRVAVLADMLELGKSSAAEHRLLAAEIGRIGGVDLVLLYGPETKRTHRALRGEGGAGMLHPPMHFDDRDALIERLLAMIGPDDIVLVKGSRGMVMEHVVRAIMEYGGR